MGVPCIVCGKAWATKIPDSDGGRRCYGHSINRKGHGVPTTVGMTVTSARQLRSRAQILEGIEEAYGMAKEQKDPAAMIGAAKAATVACQMIDPTAPEQELGSFVVHIVSRDSPPARLPEPQPEPRADAE